MQTPFKSACGNALWSVFLGTVAAAAIAQTVAPEIRNLPLWTGEVAASKLPNQFVFRDTDGQIVVSYPASPGSNERVTFRFWLQNRVAPTITLALGRTTDGQITYRYTLQNGLEAKVGIRTFSVVTPPTEDIHPTHPAWHGINPSRIVVAPQALLKGAATGVYLSWLSAGLPIAPGASLGGFQIVTSLRPGVTTAYVRGDEAPIHPPAGELPEPVGNQLLPLQRGPVMMKTVPTIGPRFRLDESRQTILHAYQSDIQDLIESGYLPGESPYLSELRSAIARVIDNGGALSPPRNAPATPLELQLFTALSLALGN